jgi:hypothetical protein
MMTPEQGPGCPRCEETAGLKAQLEAVLPRLEAIKKTLATLQEEVGKAQQEFRARTQQQLKGRTSASQHFARWQGMVNRG